MHADAVPSIPTPALPILLLPGWLNSGDGHWQTRWEARHGDVRVLQDEWVWPRRGDWMARLEEHLLAQPGPVLLAAHSLGCWLVSAWAAHSAHTDRVRGALLVAPPDLAQPELIPQLHNWRHTPAPRLPFPSVLVYSDDDPWSTPERSQALAQAWGARPQPVGARGHLNAESGVGDWPEARAWLRGVLAT